MAQVTLKNLVVAPITAETEGQPITYGAGRKVGNLMQANISWNRGNTKLHGDDKLVAKDNSPTSGTLSIKTTYMAIEDRAMVLGIKKNSDTGAGDAEYIMFAEEAPNLGVGYVWKDNLVSTNPYFAYWYYKVQFSLSEEMNTKGENVEYGTPSIEGEVFPVSVSQAESENRCRLEAAFATEAAAIAWINAKAGITT